MNHKHPDNISFQITGKLPDQWVVCLCVLIAHFYVVGELILSSCLVKQDICVTISIGDVSKITCAGNLSEDGLTVTWNHPFLLQVFHHTISIYLLINSLTALLLHLLLLK